MYGQLKQNKKELKTGMKALYSSTEKLNNSGITNKVMTGMIQHLFLELKELLFETLPEYLINKEALLTKDKALLNIHFPKTTDLLARAQFRLKFEELFYIQLQLILKNLIHKSKIKGQKLRKMSCSLVFGQTLYTFFNNAS